MMNNWLTSRKSYLGSSRPTGSRAKTTRMHLEVEWLEGRLVPTATRYPDFALPDLHPSTPTTGQNVGPVAFRGTVSGYYFTNPG
jgi:hypothetical protein